MSNVTPLSTAVQHPASVDAYIRHGWSLVPIPPGTKGPQTQGWNLKEKCLGSQGDLPTGHGIGLAHAYSGTMALDIDHWDRAAVELMTLGVSLDGLYAAPDAVVVHSGRAGHGKLLYAMPFGLALPSKKLSEADPEGRSYNYLDFRCGTMNGLTVQDVLPPSIHPDTLSPYRWAGAGHWTRLPTIPQPLLDYWSSLVERDNAPSIVTGEPISATWSEVQDALNWINPDCTRDEWIQVGMALHYAGSATDRLSDAYNLWNDWSSRSTTKYPGMRLVYQQWRSMRTDKSNMVRIGTLFHYAKQNGWVRPSPNVSHLFSATSAVPEMDTILTSFQVPPPDMDMSLWPSLLRRRAEEIAEHKGCDPLVPLFAGLAAVCGAVDARTRLELMPGWSVPPVLWLMTIGAPADKKTPGSGPLFAPLKLIEKEDQPNYAKALLAWEGKQAQHDGAKKAFLQWSASPESMLGSDGPMVPDLPPAPVPLRIRVNDITSQKLIRSAAERPRGLLCHLDEMSAWVRKMTDKTSGEDRSSWVVSYESESYLMDRVGAGAIHAENLAVSIYGNIQPDIYRKALAALTEDGLLQRFIPALLRRGKTKKNQPVPDELTSASQWENLLRLTYALPTMNYKLSPEAYDLFRSFQDWYEQRKIDEAVLQASNSFMTAFGKIEGTLGRLALVMHLIEQPFGTYVSGDTMSRAIRVVQTYVVPALRHSIDGLGESSPFQAWIADWIVCNCDRASVTLGLLRARAFKQIEHLTPFAANNIIIRCMGVLEEGGWVTRIDDGSQEYRHYAEWAVNPKIITQFDAYRRRREELRRQRSPTAVQVETEAAYPGQV